MESTSKSDLLCFAMEYLHSKSDHVYQKIAKHFGGLLTCVVALPKTAVIVGHLGLDFIKPSYSSSSTLLHNEVEAL
jgi:hypothetical protein